MKEDEGGTTYRCANCEQSVTVFVKAKVRCRRCGRPMKVIKKEIKVGKNDTKQTRLP